MINESQKLVKTRGAHQSRPISRILSDSILSGQPDSNGTRRPFIWACCCQQAQATYPFRLSKQIEILAGHLIPVLPGGETTWSCSGWGLPCLRGHPRSGGLLLFPAVNGNHLFTVASM